MKKILESDRLSASFILLLLAMIVTLSGIMARIDYVIYDAAQKYFAKHPPPNDLIIVAVDEESLASQGRWPWSRQVHADLIARLKQEGAAVIAFDILFSEPDARPGLDDDLARALALAGNVVLPVILESSRVNGQLIESLPLPSFAEHVALGRVHAVLDEDGQARGVYLWEGLGDLAWPHFAQSVLQVANQTPSSLQRLEPKLTPNPNSAQPFGIVRDKYRKINFTGPPGHMPHISYSQVLKGQYPQGLFKDKIVLVGATAIGIGDALPTPVSGLNRPMPGVEFHANVIEAMRHWGLVKVTPRWPSALVCGLLALLPILWLPVMKPFAGLMASVAGLVVLVLLSIAMPIFFAVWIPPAGALFAWLSAYPIWSWRKLEAATRFLDQELRKLRQELQSMGEDKLRLGSDFDPIQARITNVQAASDALRDVHQHRREMLAFVSHDIRAPLANMLLQIESGKLTLEKLKKPLTKSLALVEDFLQISRAEMLGTESYHDVDVVSVAHQAIDGLHEFSAQKKVRVKRELPEDCIWVKGEFSLLERAIANLLHNAIKHSKARSEVIVEISTEEDVVIVQVKDSGEGITPELLPHLFSRFSRGNSLKSNIYAGSSAGLGLYFVKTVVDRHGGTVVCESIPQSLTCFTVKLPRSQA